MIKNDLEPKLGAIYTPIEIAKAVSHLVISKFKKNELDILEPSVGDGLFIKAIDGVGVKYHLTAIDINKEVISILENESPGNNSLSKTFINADFIDYSNNNNNQYDLIFGNPPFIKKHDYTDDFKESIKKLSELSNYDLKDLKNAWAAFVVASVESLKADGILSFIVPYELMNVSYGQNLQKALFIDFERVDIYVPDEKAFKGIDQDAVLFIAQKKSVNEPGVYVHRVSSLCNLRIISTGTLNLNSPQALSVDLKSFLFDSKTKKLLHKIRKRCNKIGDICVSSPGIVTGANDFFIQTKKNIEKYDLTKYSKKILKKSSFLNSSPFFNSSDFDELEKKEACYFVYFKNDEYETLPLKVKDFLLFGEQQGLPLRYKCSRRKVWYEVPLMKETEGFFFKRSHNFPRLCVNNARVLVTDTAYRLTMNDKYTIQGLCYSFYNSLTLLFAEIDGRFYGGGVLELTPSEFKGLPIVYREPTAEDLINLEKAYLDEKTEKGRLAFFGDQWLKEELRLTTLEMNILKNTLSTLKNHRLRHGK